MSASGECTYPVRISDKQVLGTDIVELTLAHPDKLELPEWTAGAHIDLFIDTPNGSSPLLRQYSVTGSPHDRSAYRIAVLREPAGRGGSAAVHDTLRPGQVVTVRGPRNHFALLPSAKYLFIAGGIGITPIVPMLYEAQARGADWRLLYGGRTIASMAYLPLLREWNEQVTVWPQDERGLLPLQDQLAIPRTDTLVYCCGPTALIDAVTKHCAAWPERSLHVERFAPIAVDHPTAERPFRVVLARSDLTLDIEPGTSILDAVESAGVRVLASCREGTCGTCETSILAGRAKHCDSVLSAEEQEEQDALMICVSRSQTDELVLDL